MAGAFGAYLTITHVTRNVLGVLVGGMAVALAVGLVVERLAIRPVRGRYVMIPFIATSGAGIALQHGAERLFGSDPVLVPPVMPSVSYSLGPLSVTKRHHAVLRRYDALLQQWFPAAGRDFFVVLQKPID